MLEFVKTGESILAVILRSSYQADGINFVTPDELTQQLAYMNHPKGHVIRPHAHNPVRREVIYTTEVLFIKSGRVRVDLYTSDDVYLESRILACGDFVLLSSGGHGLEIIEDSEIVEIKQGPYVGEGDKRRFEPAKSGEITIGNS